VSNVDANQILAQFPGSVTIHASRTKWLRHLLVNIVFVSIGVWQVSKGLWIGWLLVSFFGLGAIICATLLLPGAGKLTLDVDGFQTTSLFRGSRLHWTDVAGFKAHTMPFSRLSKKVYFNVSTLTGRPIAKLNVALFGRNSALADTYGLSADELACVMEYWRNRAVGE
jgi:hypothetical protein